MATESSGFNEAMDVGTSTISHLKALKTASTITKAGFGAAGGPFTAAVGIAIANRHGIAKIIIVIIAILLLPVLFILMLPGLIFGSLMEDTGALNSNTIINDNIRASREAIVEVLEESHADILSEINAAIAKLPEGDTASINDSYTYNISVNANLLISQFCASQDNYENINLRKLKSLIRKNKDGLFSYDVATETVTMEVVVEGGAEGENSPKGNENAEPQTKTVTFTRHTYTVQYAGDAYFADHVFHLTDEQKKLAQDYAENLTTFFGNAASGVLLTRITAGFPEFEWSQNKIFGNPDANGYSTAQQFFISRHVYNSKQEVQNSPWRIQIVNGKGIKKQNRNGGSYMQAKSFVSEKTAFIQLTDMDLYTLLKRVDSYITNWEAAYAPTLIINGKQMLNQQRQAQQPAAAPYNQGQYAEPNFYVA